MVGTGQRMSALLSGAGGATGSLAQMYVVRGYRKCTDC